MPARFRAAAHVAERDGVAGRCAPKRKRRAGDGRGTAAKGFPSFVVNPTTDGFYRVQVGPFDSQAIGDEAKQNLQRAGFKAIYAETTLNEFLPVIEFCLAIGYGARSRIFVSQL